MPGMIDTHRHLWQTVMRGYGADWTLTQYFVWYYLQWGKVFRPQDIFAGRPSRHARKRLHQLARLETACFSWLRKADPRTARTHHCLEHIFFFRARLRTISACSERSAFG